MKLQKKPIPQEPRTEKIMMPGDLASALDDYANYYEFTYSQKISPHDLILEMLGVFMKSDRDFKKWSGIEKNKKSDDTDEADKPNKKNKSNERNEREEKNKDSSSPAELS